jgi:4-amino-4-deoxy-L-arabinose transferase-like glycosyltransferase
MPDTERKPVRRRAWLAVAAITAGALALRLAGIWWGLPNSQHYFSYHPDEIFLLMPAFGFAQGDWNPHFFNYGTLYIYLVGLPAVIFGIVPGSVRFPQGLAPLYLTARIVTALLGTATIPVLFTALRRESRPLAWGSALLLTICPLHVINSHYATVDVPATFFLVVAFLFALRGAERPTLRHAIVTGLFVGLAAATKYNAGLFLLPAVLAPVLVGQERVSCPGPRKRKLGGPSWWLGLPAGALVAFLVCNPWIGTPEFRQGFLFEWRHAQAGGTFAFVGAGSGWSYHVLRGLPVALGYPLLVAVIASFVLAFRSKSPAVRLSLVWVILYFFVIGFGKERFIRYLVPMMPFVCVLAAGVIGGEPALSGKAARATRATLAIAIAVLTAAYLSGLLFPLVYPFDVRDRAWDSSDSPIRYAESVGLVQVPWYFHPPISPYNAGAFSQGLFNAWNEKEGHRVLVTGWDAKALERDRPEVFVLSDLESADPVRLGMAGAREFVAEFDRLYQLRDEYREYPVGISWLAPGRQWSPPDWLYPSPRITVYYSPRYATH